MTADEQLKIIKRGTVEIIDEDTLRDKIKTSIEKRQPLIIKAGFDPSAPDLHLGHTVLLRKLRHFQDLGHKVVFLIGDFTAMIGDPSGASKTRPRLTKEEVAKNAKTYVKQISKVLDVNKLEVRFNSEWLEKMKGVDIAGLMSKYSVSRMLERDDFLNRYKQQKPISILEFLYPLLQGYDSVCLKADVEIGGTDQKFNLLVGRDIQFSYGQKRQVVITMPLLEGTDGVQKMSKSYGNYVGINEPAEEMYGKLMSISDELMWKYYELLTDLDLSSVKAVHPMDAKKKLAYEIVKQYHGDREAEAAQRGFEKNFQEKDPFTDRTVTSMSTPTNLGLQLINLLCKPDMYENYEEKLPKLSTSECKRLVKQDAIMVNGTRVTDINNYQLMPDTIYNIKVGKRTFVKIVLKVKKSA